MVGICIINSLTSLFQRAALITSKCVLPWEKNASSKGQKNLDVLVLSPPKPDCCQAGSQHWRGTPQPKANPRPALQKAACRAWTHLSLLQLCHQLQNQGMCTSSKNPWPAPNPLPWPLNLYPITRKLCPCTHHWHAEWAACITSVLDAPFIQVPVQWKVTAVW